MPPIDNIIAVADSMKRRGRSLAGV